MSKKLKDYDILTKAISVLIATVVWLWVADIKNPLVDLEYNDLIVDITSQNQLRDVYSLIITENEFPKVSLTLSGEREIVTRVSHSNIIITSDISHITEPGTYDLNYIVKLPYDTISVKKSTPSIITVTVDTIEAKTLPLYVNLSGTPEKNYSFNDVFTQETFSISAPANIASQISYAEVEVNVKNMTTNINGLYPVKFYSDTGEIITHTSIIPESDTVLVVGDILKTSSVNLAVDFETPTIEDNIRKVNFDTKQVSIIGYPDVVDSIDEIVIGTIYSSDYDKNRTNFIFALPFIDGITYLSDDTIAVTLTYNEYITHNISISDYMIESDISDLIELADDVTISVSGNTSDFEDLDFNSLKIELLITREELLALEKGSEKTIEFILLISDEFDVSSKNKITIKVK